MLMVCRCIISTIMASLNRMRIATWMILLQIFFLGFFVLFLFFFPVLKALSLLRLNLCSVLLAVKALEKFFLLKIFKLLGAIFLLPSLLINFRNSKKAFPTNISLVFNPACQVSPIPVHLMGLTDTYLCVRFYFGGVFLSCYHPIMGWPIEECGKIRYQPRGRYDPSFKTLDPRIIPIPCGRCVGCRLDYSRSWADRMMLELEIAGCAVFITLTYDNDHVSYCCWDDTGEVAGLTLNKRDWQLFMKRLRKQFSDRQLTFYASGEYGEHTHRPHMHAIVFGLSLDDFTDRKIKGKNELGQIYYISDRLTSIWQNGFTMLCDVSWKTCAYVSRYVMKKIVEDAEFLVECTDLVPEFALMSRRPAIARRYLDAHPDCLDFSAISVKGKEDPVRIPKYYLDRLSLTDPEKYAKIKQERKQFASDRLLLKLQQTDLSFLELLEVEENNKLNRTASLKRSVE